MSNGLDARQLLEFVIRPVLAQIGLNGHAAERLVLGTAAVESGLWRIKQVGGGPALGLWQMEPATYRSLWRDLLGLPARAGLRHAILELGPWLNPPEPAKLISDLALGAAMCRVRYLWDPHPLPAEDDVRGMADTWKRSYNSHLGAGTPEHFIRAWDRLVAPVLD